VNWTLLIVAVVAGWLVQGYFTYKQSMAFNRSVVSLRRHGTVSVGVAGKRYRGGRAYVALALDEQGTVRDALVLSGWTTLARGRPLPALVGARASALRRDDAVPGLTRPQRDAARQAVELARTRVST
jgi:glucitol operon activator protein